MLPVYVINLDRRPDRLASIAAGLDRLEMKFERIAAVDARNLPSEGDRVLGAAEHACLVSHRKALERFLGTVAPAALILEDDVVVSRGLPRFVVDMEWWPAGRGLIKLDTKFEKPRLLGRHCGSAPAMRHLREMVMGNAGCGGYLVDRATAARILGADDDPTFPIDRLLFDFRVSRTAKRLRAVQCVPPVVRHGDDFGSDIGTDRRKARSAAARRKGRLRRQFSNPPPWTAFPV